MKKNILFISVDDLRPEINCLGKKKLYTPHMDNLAKKGLVFENAYCQAPKCMPSRASLLSGIRPDENVYGRIKYICTKGEPTIPLYFKQNNYTTVSVGKVYHWNDEDELAWDKKYRDTFYEQDYACHGYCSGYQLEKNKKKIKSFRKHLIAQRKEIPFDKSTLPDIYECADVPDSNYPDAKISEIAINELDKLSKKENPFFLALGYYRPHLPWAVPKKYWDLYKREDVDLADNQFFPLNGIGKSDLVDFMHYHDEAINNTYSDFGSYQDDDFPVLDEDKQRACIHAYWASVSFVDAQIGVVLDKLKELDIEDETIVVLYGDNGWHLGEHKLWSKCTSFEESTHVPLIISDPEIINLPRSSKSLVELLDIYPTLCDLCGLEKPGHLQGLSLKPILMNPCENIKDVVYSRLHNFSSLRTKEYRLTYYNRATAVGDKSHIPNKGKYELFDLINDPEENINVARDTNYNDVLSKLLDKML